MGSREIPPVGSGTCVTGHTREHERGARTHPKVQPWYASGRGARSSLRLLRHPVVLLRGLPVRRPFGV